MWQPNKSQGESVRGGERAPARSRMVFYFFSHLICTLPDPIGWNLGDSSAFLLLPGSKREEGSC